MVKFDDLRVKRYENWGQTASNKIDGPMEGVELINRVGVATLFHASSEFPSLYDAYMGEPHAPTEAKWDSPSGEVYTWRWILGQKRSAFYTALVRKKPTWISWRMVPAMLRICGELRSIETLYEDGLLSIGAYRIAKALAQSGGVLDTGELRHRAGFPTGKEHRAAYMKAMEELDYRLITAKVFSKNPEENDMRHALVVDVCADSVCEAKQLSEEAAVDLFLNTYLPGAKYINPALVSKQLGIQESKLRERAEWMVQDGRLAKCEIPGAKDFCYALAGL